MKHVFLLGCLSAMLASVAQANVYSCIVNGEKIYTNKKVGNCHSEKLDKIGSYTSDRSIIDRQNRLSDEKIAAQRNGNQDNSNAAPPVQQAAAPAARNNRPAVAAAPELLRRRLQQPVIGATPPARAADQRRWPYLVMP
jgi:hypothetical protein